MLCQSIMTAQIASPTFTHVYAALVAIINTKFPNIGELLLKRLIVNFKRGFKRNDKTRCVSSSRYDSVTQSQAFVYLLKIQSTLGFTTRPRHKGCDQVVAKTNADYTPLGIATSKGVDGRYFPSKVTKLKVVIPKVVIIY